MVLDSKTSPSSPVTSGVPQGTVLSPLLFLIYINDLPSRVSSTARLFADDCLLYRVISNQEDTASLQDLDHLQEWERDWQIVLTQTSVSTSESPIKGRSSRLHTRSTVKYRRKQPKQSTFESPLTKHYPGIATLIW